MQPNTDKATGSDPAQNVVMSEGEWQGLIDLLRAATDGTPERAVEEVDHSWSYYMTNYADYIEDERSDWP